MRCRKPNRELLWRRTMPSRRDGAGGCREQVPLPDGTAESGQCAEAIARGLAVLGLLPASKVDITHHNNIMDLYLGETTVFDREHWEFLDGKIRSLHANSDPLAYIRCTGVNIGAATGISDLHLGRLVDGVWDKKSVCFFSCKWNATTAAIGAYDIAEIANAARHSNFVDFSIGLIVADKVDFISKANRSYKDDLKKYVKYVIDSSDLRHGIAHFKSIPEDDYVSIFTSRRRHVPLRLHQQIVVRKSMFALRRGCQTLLLACICRSGKTRMLGGIVEDYFREFLDGRNPSALILTPRPTETLQQWKAMFEHEMFSGFTVREKDDINTPPDQPGPVITIASKQAMDALQRHNENYTSEVLMKYDIIAFDEAHEGAGTYLNRDTMCRHSHDHTVTILMTATYLRPAMSFSIPQEDVMTWSLQDNEMLRQVDAGQQDWTALEEEHGREHVHYAIQQTGGDSSYINEQPQLRFLSLGVALPEIGLRDAGFRMTSVFRNREALRRLVDFIFGDSDQTRAHPHGTATAPAELVRREMHSPTFVTFLAFLPYGPANLLESNILAFEEAIQAEATGYDCYNLNAIGDDYANMADFVARSVLASKGRKQTGAIFVTGNRGAVGISLPEVDAVLMLKDSISADQFVQRAFRCLTADTSRRKKHGYVIDFSPENTLQAMYDYASNCGQHGRLGFRPSDIIRNLMTSNVFKIRQATLSTEQGRYNMEDLGIEAAAEILRKKFASEYPEYKQQLKRFQQMKLPDGIIEFQKDEKLVMVFARANTTPNSKKKVLPGRGPSAIPTGIVVEDPRTLLPSTPPEAERSPECDLRLQFYARLVPLLAVISWKDSSSSLLVVFEALSVMEKAAIGVAFGWSNNYVDYVDVLLQRASNSPSVRNVIGIIVDAIHHQMLVAEKVGISELAAEIAKCLKAIGFDKELRVLTKEAANSVLDALPHYLWVKPGLKWLDFAVGNGMLLAQIHKRLMHGLEETFPDADTRLTHASMSEFRQQLHASHLFRCACITTLGALPDRVRKASGEQVLYLTSTTLGALQPSHVPVNDRRPMFQQHVFVQRDWHNFIVKLLCWMDADPDNRKSIGTWISKGLTRTALQTHRPQATDDSLDINENSPLRAQMDAAIRVHVSNVGRADGTNMTLIKRLPEKCALSLLRPKVITPALAARDQGEPLGLAARNTRIIPASHIYSEAFVGWQLDAHEEAESFISYMKTNFVHNMIRMAKSDYNIDKSALRWVPTLPWDRIWTDAGVLDYMELGTLWPACALNAHARVQDDGDILYTVPDDDIPPDADRPSSTAPHASSSFADLGQPVRLDARLDAVASTSMG